MVDPSPGSACRVGLGISLRCPVCGRIGRCLLAKPRNNRRAAARLGVDIAGRKSFVFDERRSRSPPGNRHYPVCVCARHVAAERSTNSGGRVLSGGPIRMRGGRGGRARRFDRARFTPNDPRLIRMNCHAGRPAASRAAIRPRTIPSSDGTRTRRTRRKCSTAAVRASPTRPLPPTETP